MLASLVSRKTDLLLRLLCCLLYSGLAACSSSGRPDYDVVIRGGEIFDGTGAASRRADIAIIDDRIAKIGDVGESRGQMEIDAHNLAIAPGFINVLSWADESLIQDGRAYSDLMQGVTLEIFGEGHSKGPLSEEMAANIKSRQGDIKYDVEWRSLGEYLEYLERRGVSPNIASFVGATTVRVHELGHANRAPNADELARMQDLVRGAMEEGALGVGSSLIYAPAFFAETEELIALAKAAAEYGGVYISHMRSEGAALEEALEELFDIARSADIPAEIYHLKAAGRSHWSKLDGVIENIEAARADGLKITADIYPYDAGATGLDAVMPPWVQEGGYEAWAERLKDPKIRTRVLRDMREPTGQWENFFIEAGPEKILLVGFKNKELKPLMGKTLAEVARERSVSPADAAIDLVIEDGSRVLAIYTLMSEENIRRKLQMPWVSFGSDASAPSPEGVFLKLGAHPRAYGTFSRVLGKYVREENLIPLSEAIRRMTSLPASNFNLEDRGLLQKGYYADIVVFDPETITDHATYAAPHQTTTGVAHVLVNGVPVVTDGRHTGATPGRVVRGPGWRKSREE